MRYCVLLIFLCAAPLSAIFATQPSPQAQVQAIDAQIEELTKMKRGYEARALRHNDQAERLQFNDKVTLEVRRHLELAQENQDIADKIQQQIDKLQAQRLAILQKSGQLPLKGGDGYEDL